MERKEIEEKIRNEFRERTGYEIYNKGINSYVDIDGKTILLERNTTWENADVVIEASEKEDIEEFEVIDEIIDYLAETLKKGGWHSMVKFPEVKVGDICISKEGWSYKIVGICDCEDCKIIGFPRIDLINMLGGEEVIDSYDLESGFKMWYKVGNTIYKENVEKSDLKRRLSSISDEIKCIADQSRNIVEMLEVIENGTV